MVNSASPAALPRICFQNFALRASPVPACPSARGQGLRPVRVLIPHASPRQTQQYLHYQSIRPPSRHNLRHNRRQSYLYRYARQRPARLSASAAVSLSAPPEPVPYLPISSAPPQPPRTSARGEASPLRLLAPLLVPCVLPRVLAPARPCPLHPLRSCVRQLCPASAGARACALDKRLDIGKRLHSASRTAAKAYNRRPEAAAKSATSPRRRGRLYYIMMSSMPQRAPPCQPCQPARGERIEANKKPRRASARRGVVMGSGRLQRLELLEA